MTLDQVEHFNEGKGPHCDVTGAMNLETWLLIKGNQEVLTHEHSTADIGQAAEVLEVPPHQDGAFPLLTEGPMDSQDMDVDSGPVWLMESQSILENREMSLLILLVLLLHYIVTFSVIF